MGYDEIAFSAIEVNKHTWAKYVMEIHVLYIGIKLNGIIEIHHQQAAKSSFDDEIRQPHLATTTPCRRSALVLASWGEVKGK